jgi:ATP-dependent DNA helicase PIF1
MDILNTDEDLLHISPIKFQEMVMELYKALGCDVQPLRIPGRHHLYVSITMKDGRASLAECHISLHEVDKDVVGSFLALMKKAKVFEGAIITLGEVAEKARRIAKKKRLYLYDGNEFLSFWKSLNISAPLSPASQLTSIGIAQNQTPHAGGIQGGEPQDLEPATSLPAQTEPNIWIPAESEEPTTLPPGQGDLFSTKPARSQADIHHLLGGDASAIPVTQPGQPPDEPDSEDDLPAWLTAPTPAEFMAEETPPVEEPIHPVEQTDPEESGSLEAIPTESDLLSEPVTVLSPEEIHAEADLHVEPFEVIPSEEISPKADLPSEPAEDIQPEVIPLEADLPVEPAEDIQPEVIPFEADLMEEPVEVFAPDVTPFDADLPVISEDIPPEVIPLEADLPVEPVEDIPQEILAAEDSLTEESAEAVPPEVIPPKVDLLAGLEELQKAAIEEEAPPVLLIPAQTPPDEPAAEVTPAKVETGPSKKTSPFSTPIILDPPVERVLDENANVIQRLFGEEPPAAPPDETVETPVEEIPSQPPLEMEKPSAMADGDETFTSEEQSIWTANVEKKIRIETEPANAHPADEAVPPQLTEPSDLPVEQASTPPEQAVEAEPPTVNPLELVEDIQPKVIPLEADLPVEPVEEIQPEVSPFETSLLAEHGEDIQSEIIPAEDDFTEEPAADITPDEIQTEAATPPEQAAEFEPQADEFVEEVPIPESIPPIEISSQMEAATVTPAVIPDSPALEPVVKIETAPLPALPTPQIVVIDPAQYNGNILHAPDLGDPSLCMAFEKMKSSSPCIFITGRAGTRKSTLLDYFIKSTDTNTVVLSPTEIGAIYIQCSPIRSFFGFPEGPIEEKDVQEIADPAKRDMYRHIDTLVIYEVSNVSASLIDAMDTFMRRNGRDAEQPFGGSRLILFGDLFRPAWAGPEADGAAAPIEGYRSNYFFDAHVFESLPIQLIELQHDYYHRSEELNLLLNSIKTNSLADAQQQFLNSKHIPGFVAPADEVYVTLTATDSEAARINNEQLKKLPMPECTQIAEVEDRFYEHGYPVERELTFRRGAQVMFLSNDRTKRWVRGTVGKVTSVSESSLQVRIDYEDSPFILRVERENWQAYGYTFDPASGKIEKEVIGEYTQYPLCLAWAVSVDKSQGSCFNNVIIDPGESTLDYQLAYAALCSCKSLDGIVLRSSFAQSDASGENNRILHIARLFGA